MENQKFQAQNTEGGRVYYQYLAPKGAFLR
jgi:hypothetical protein